MNSRLWLGLICLVLLLSSCEDYFGSKTDLDFIEIPDFQNREIAYVPIQPVLDQFVRPTDVMAGYDLLIYVVDEATSEIISFDQSGRELGRMIVPGVKSLAQDRSLDLLAIGTKDTNIAGTDYTLTCIYRINPYQNGTYSLTGAAIENETVHPTYFKSTFSSSDAVVQFNHIAVLNDNSYYVTRTGTSNNNTQVGGPDDAVLLFNRKDEFISPIAITSQGGFFLDFFKQPSGITSLAQPPQFTVSPLRDFVYTSIDPEGVLKVQYIEYVETENGVSYSPRQLIEGDTTQAEGFLTTPNRFGQPVSATIAGDGTNHIFVVDTDKDSLYQFASNGLEGIRPPAGSTSNRYVIASFGGTGQSLTEFNDPMGVAYLEQIVYVADAGNGRVLRFKLTLDFD